MQKQKRAVEKIQEKKKRAMIASIKGELDLYQHGLPALNTVYLILKRMRIGKYLP